MTYLIDRIGRRYGRLLVVRLSGYCQRSRMWEWECTCECGKTTIVSGSSLGSGHARSCGCLQKEIAREGKFVHGHSHPKSPTYMSWVAMMGRCLNHNHSKYHRYGGRGVTVCQRWRNFGNFLDDMGERPAGKTLDRFPNFRGDYEPGNCRWATPKEQSANHRPTSEYLRKKKLAK